jgi:hypothetical protein
MAINLIFNSKDEYENIVKKFYEYVVDKRDIKHFFFGINLDRILEDQFLYLPLIVRKPKRYYKETVMQTAPSGIQIKVPQFDEICFVMRMLLEQEGYPKNLIPMAATNMIEIMEETRAQIADSEVKVWKPLEIDKELISDFYNKNRTDARIEKNGDVYISSGLPTPTWTRVVPDKTKIIFIAQAFSAGQSTPIETFNHFCHDLNAKIDYIHFHARESNMGPVMFARHEMNYAAGLPSRMFMRAMRVFASNFESGVRLDLNQILKSTKK